MSALERMADMAVFGLEVLGRFIWRLAAGVPALVTCLANRAKEAYAETVARRSPEEPVATTPEE